MPRDHFDVLIVGGGLSGVDAGYHLQTKCPGKTYAILEGRERMGGTWDLFRYPGIRSDSDMFTLGYSFRPWRGEKAITDGASILDYIKDTAREYRHRQENPVWPPGATRILVLARCGLDGGSGMRSVGGDR